MKVFSEPVGVWRVSAVLDIRLTSITAIMESGNAVGPPYNGTEWHQPMYDRFVERAGYV